MSSINYKEVVTQARHAARDVLRTRKVNALLGYIRNVNAKIKSIKASVEQDAKILATQEYDLRIATEFENPNLESMQKSVAKTKERHEEFAEAQAKEVKACEDKNAEYEEKIENWNTGKSKVSYDEMCSIALGMVQTRIGETFSQGEYDDASEAIPEEIEASEEVEDETEDEVSS